MVGIMPEKKAASKTPVLTYGIIVMLLIVIAALFYSNSQSKQAITYANSGSGSQNQSYASLQANYSMLVSKLNGLEQNYTALMVERNSSGNVATQEVVQSLYSDKTVHIAAPTHNYNYSYLNGCYWISGYDNFSFYAPYAGYIIFNQTNTGKISNKTFNWFGISVSTQKAQYDVISPYNLTGCTGETFWSIIAPWVYAGPANNQTIIIPVTNGTNYVILYNNNAYAPWSFDSPINVTFSIKYVGFKPQIINNPFPPYNSESQSSIVMPSLNTKLTLPLKVLVGDNLSKSPIDNFNVKLVAIGAANPYGISPAIINLYFNKTAYVNDSLIYPGASASFNVSGHVLRVYINQTSSEYSATKWATIQLFN